MELGKRGWSPLVVTCGTEEVVEDLEDDGDTAPWVIDTILANR